MLKNNFAKRLLIGITTFLVLMVGSSFLFQTYTKHQAQKDVERTKRSIEAFKKRQLRSHIAQSESLISENSVKSTGSHSLPENEETKSANKGSSQIKSKYKMPSNSEQDSLSPDESHREWEKRRAELSQRVIELSEESSLISQMFLDSVDDELSLMNSFLAGISKAEREIAKRALQQMYPEDSKDLNDFFNEIDNAPNLSHLEISDRAKDLIISRKTRDMLRQQHEYKWNQLRTELDEFYGGELSNSLEVIKSQNNN